MNASGGRSRRARKPPVELELPLLEWGPRGTTRAEAAGRTMHIDRGIPGETVRAVVDRRRKPWRGVVDAPVEPSPRRIAPPCPYYARGCGGCQWQHMDYQYQLETKRALVDRELHRAGLDVPVESVTGMEDPWHYRSTAAIAIGWEAGFRPRGRRGIVEIHDCLISLPLIGRLADRVNDLLRAGGLPNYHGKVWLDSTVTGNAVAPRLQILIQGIEGLTVETHPELPEVARTLSNIESVGSVAFRHRSGTAVALVGQLMDTVEIAGRSMYLPAGSFLQSNLQMLPIVLERMRHELAGRGYNRAADIYGGIGTFGLPLASEVSCMKLIELDPLAVEAARLTAELWDLGNMEFVSRHAEDAVAELHDLDFTIVDPPRSGLGHPVTSALIAARIPLVFYVSCSPASLARDLAMLAGAYRVDSLDLFDFYPQTYHVESLAVLRLL